MPYGICTFSIGCKNPKQTKHLISRHLINSIVFFHRERSKSMSRLSDFALRLGRLDSAYGGLQGVLHGVMEEEDVRTLYLWLERLAKNPHTEDEARSIVAGMPILPIYLP